MEREQVVFVRCAFQRGAFPHERGFLIRFDDGSEYRGVAPGRYCLAQDRKSIAKQPNKGSEVDGWIVGILISRDDNGNARIQLPDGDVYELTSDRFVTSPRTEDVHVSIES